MFLYIYVYSILSVIIMEGSNGIGTASVNFDLNFNWHISFASLGSLCFKIWT